MSLVGWHYTSESNWLSIRSEGLVPYKLYRPELRWYFGRSYFNGVWVWHKPLSLLDELGSVLYQLSTKCDTRIVKLAVRYNDRSILRKGRQRIDICHTGHIGDWLIHVDDPRAYILNDPIPAKRIELLRTFDLMDVVSAPAAVVAAAA